MKNIFENDIMNEIINRINNLTPSSKRQWGKMEVSQMLAHCTSSLGFATGERKPTKILSILGVTIGSFFKSTYYNEKTFKKNRPTSKGSKITDKREFYRERELLTNKINQLIEGDEKCKNYPHPYFGYLTSKQWGMGIYKHLDHHLRQFNV